MDRITTSYLKEFKKEQSLEKLKESDAFEHFANYCIVSDIHDEEFSITDVHTGGGSDLGIDGISIIINGTLIESPEQVKDLAERSDTFDITFALIQAKTSSNFSWSEMSVFLDGVKDFFSEEIDVPINDHIKHNREIMKVIYDNSLKFRKKKPECRVYYVTTGEWVSDQYLTARCEGRTRDIERMGIFSKVYVTPLGADDIQDSYLRSKNSATARINFPNKVLLPDITGVSEAYLGTVPASEFVKIITDKIGNIKKSLFVENVRDFQEYNTVNQEIKNTLNDPLEKEKFVVLNNGITIVARGLSVVRNNVDLTDYQIVNGCQTSHVLFHEADQLTEAVQVPLKIIATQEEEVINSIIMATNSQTEVTAEDLFAMGKFAKKLEKFLASYEEKQKIFYERRSKQYNATPGIEKVRIITKLQQIRAFAAMFLDEPHRASSYHTELHSQVGDKIFNDRHKLEPYYASAYGYYKLEFFFRNNAIPVSYKPARFQILMAFRYLSNPGTTPELHANKIASYSHRICENLWDTSKAINTFNKCMDIIDSASKNELNREIAKTRGFTETVKELAIKASK